MLSAAQRDEYFTRQDWEAYGAPEHAVWRTLYRRQEEVLAERACPEYLEALRRLEVTADGIPDFRRLSEVLDRATGWQIVAVTGLLPDEIFFDLLANRRFPSTCFIRRPDQLDYLPEPDVFHDIFGHVPLLMNPIFADYMQAYGQGGVKAMRLGALDRLTRLYWYTVEFGLIETPKGLRIYGSGIVSSRQESIYCLESDRPHRLRFDLLRIMRTGYRYDDLQRTYFVIRDFQELFDATRPDFTPFYKAMAGQPDIDPTAILPDDAVIHRGTQAGG